MNGQIQKAWRYEQDRRSFLIFAVFMFFLINLFSSSSFAVQPDSDCIDWFNEGKLNRNTKDCVVDCAALETDMSTFMCPNECPALCKNPEPSLLGKFIYYPGLTKAEKNLVATHPKDALNVFVQKTRAEMSSERNFPDQGLNDEGDAFRHFIWAGLLTKELGPQRAKEFLDAHEANLLETKAEEQMDNFNNSIGQKAAQELIAKNRWSMDNLEKRGLDSLRSHELNVLKPGLKIPEVPK